MNKGQLKHLYFWQCLEVFIKSSEVAGMFSEILVITIQKSHVFESEKVGRYTFLVQSSATTI